MFKIPENVFFLYSIFLLVQKELQWLNFLSSANHAYFRRFFIIRGTNVEKHQNTLILDLKLCLKCQKMLFLIFYLFS